MIFSKSFGYAVRGVLYVALMQKEKRYVQVEEIATGLAVPRHFMGKVLKKLVKEKILLSVKGPSGGFTVHEDTLNVSLIRVINITDGLGSFKTCVLRVKECNRENPCPMHGQVEAVRLKLNKIMTETRIGELLSDNKADFLKSISNAEEDAVLLPVNH